MGIQDVRETIKSCRFCFMCRHACPTFLATKLDSHTPRGYALLLSQIDEGYRSWTKETIDRFYQCSQCGLCREDCEYHWQEDELVRNAREDIVKGEHTPERVKKIASSLIQKGTPYEKETAKGNVPSGIVGKKDTDILYFAGCSTRQNHSGILESLSKIFQAIAINWTMLQGEGCCGTPLYELGYTGDAKKAAEKLATKISEINPKILLTGCPHCFRAFKEFYPQWGLHFSSKIQIVHTSQYLATQITNGTLKLEPEETFSSLCYHDPCQLGRKLNEYEAPRRLINAATGKVPLELFHDREHAECCGAGSVMFLTDPNIAVKVAKKRLERVHETHAEVIITACQNCKTSFINAQNHLDNPIQVMDVTELIASRLKG
jgi:Fe-S oxidoreductase